MTPLMLAILLVHAPAAAPAASVAPGVTLLVLNPEGDDPALSGVLAGAVTRALGEDSRARVFSSADVKHLASLASEQQLAGCDSSTCLVEIGDALGARYVIFGTALQAAGQRRLELSLFDVKETAVVARDVAQGADKAALVNATAPAVRRLVHTILPRPLFARPLVVAGAITAATAGAATATGLVGVAIFNDVAGDPRSRGDDKELARAAGPWTLLGTVVLGAVAVAGGGMLAAGIVGSD